MRQHNIAMATIKDIQRHLEDSPARETHEVSKVQALRLLSPQILLMQSKGYNMAHVAGPHAFREGRGRYGSHPEGSHLQSIQVGSRSSGGVAGEATEANGPRDIAFRNAFASGCASGAAGARNRCDNQILPIGRTRRRRPPRPRSGLSGTTRFQEERTSPFGVHRSTGHQRHLTRTVTRLVSRHRVERTHGTRRAAASNPVRTTTSTPGSKAQRSEAYSNHTHRRS